MILSVSLVVLGGLGAAVAASSSRKAKMARFARDMGARFVAEKENIITEITANKMDFFTQFVHRFSNVITFSKTDTFTRVGDDVFYPEGKPKQKANYTLISTELLMHSFPALKIEPASHLTHSERYVQVRTNIAEIDKYYNVYLPQDTALNLPPSLCSLLKTRQDVYLESADNVCLVHVYKQLTPDEVQLLRFRVGQIVSDLEIIPQKPQEDKKTPAVTDAGTRAEAMVAAMMASRARPADKSSKSSGGLLILIMMVVLGGMLFFAYYFLKNMVAH